MDWYERKYEALLKDASEGTSGVRLMDDLKDRRIYRWMETGSISLTVNIYN